MKIDNILVYGNNAVYGNIALSVLKIDKTLRCLGYICSVSSLVQHRGLSLSMRPLAS